MRDCTCAKDQVRSELWRMSGGAQSAQRERAQRRVGQRRVVQRHEPLSDEAAPARAPRTVHGRPLAPLKKMGQPIQ